MMIDYFKTVDYYKIDDSLPDLIYDEKQSGIDLYVREDTLIYPSFNSFNIVKQNLFAIDNKPVVQQKFGCFCDNMKLNETEECPKSYTDIPLNIVLRGDSKRFSFLFPRSSLFSKYGLILANSVGVIDPSYEGVNDEIKARIINFCPQTVLVKKGERLCQLVLMDNIYRVVLKKNEEHWGSGDRGGFGSTGGYEE